MPDPINSGDGSAGGSPPADGKWVPKERLDEVLASNKTLGERLATLEGRLTERDRQSQTPPVTSAPPKEEKIYTRAQLQAAVSAGQITQDKADEIYFDQVERRLIGKVETITSTAIGTLTKQTTLESELAAYRTAKPEAFLDNGNADRAKVKAEFDYLTSRLGHASTVETELAALRAAFGPADKLRAVNERHQDPQSHSEVMGGAGNRGGDQGTDEENAGRPPKGLSRDVRAYYENGISRGVYRDWNAVRKELKHAKPGLSQRVNARLGLQ